jgi:hypothetical protein
MLNCLLISDEEKCVITLTIVVNVIKMFFFINDGGQISEGGKFFQPILKLWAKARSLPQWEHLKVALLR